MGLIFDFVTKMCSQWKDFKFNIIKWQPLKYVNLLKHKNVRF